jgi:inner membrane transporter RhtA
MVAVSARPNPIARVPPVGLVLTGVASVQIGAAIATTQFDRLGPSGVSLLRLGFAALVLVVMWRPDPRDYPRADLRLVGFFGLVLGLMNFTFYLALDRLPLGVAVTIEFAGPLGVAVATSRRRSDFVFVALAALGILLLANPGGGGVDGLGVVFVLIAAACWAAYILLAQRLGPAFEGGRGVALAMVVAAIVPVVPGIASAGTELLQPLGLLFGLGIAIMSSVVPYSLEFEALRRLPANVFGVLMSLEPAVAALAGLVILGQGLSARELVAIALVVAASAGVTLAAGRAAIPVRDA